jgi:hypothetical protein
VVGREHWWIDFPAIYLPAIVLVALWIRIRSSGEAPTR